MFFAGGGGGGGGYGCGGGGGGIYHGCHGCSHQTKTKEEALIRREDAIAATTIAAEQQQNSQEWKREKEQGERMPQPQVFPADLAAARSGEEKNIADYTVRFAAPTAFGRYRWMSEWRGGRRPRRRGAEQEGAE